MLVTESLNRRIEGPNSRTAKGDYLCERPACTRLDQKVFNWDNRPES